MNWLTNLFKKEPKYTPTELQSRVPSTLDWKRKVVILSVAPNAYKDWIYIEDLYQAFRERMKEK